MTFGADIQQSATERHSDSQSGEDQRRRVEERVADAVRPGERAADQQEIGLDRIVTDAGDENAADHEGREDGDEREHELAKEFHGLTDGQGEEISKLDES